MESQLSALTQLVRLDCHCQELGEQWVQESRIWSEVQRIVDRRYEQGLRKEIRIKKTTILDKSSHRSRFSTQRFQHKKEHQNIPKIHRWFQSCQLVLCAGLIKNQVEELIKFLWFFYFWIHKFLVRVFTNFSSFFKPNIFATVTHDWKISAIQNKKTW